jgi:phosphoribosylformimino-5-aminoimidazole carboxamide ribotide isomerase
VIVYPAIDLRGGRCVRLREGDFARETVYGDDPVAVAERWVAEGASWLHVVDLDGARAGRPVQLPLVSAICRAVSIPVQVGGGLRDRTAVDLVLAAGGRAAIVGTVAVNDPAECEAICRAHPGRIAVVLDARAGKLRTAGWLEAAEADVLQVAPAWPRWVRQPSSTPTSRATARRRVPTSTARVPVARAAAFPVIASGGVGRLDDVRGVAAISRLGCGGRHRRPRALHRRHPARRRARGGAGGAVMLARRIIPASTSTVDES